MELLNKLKKYSYNLLLIFFYIELCVIFHEIGHIIMATILNIQIIEISFFLFKIYPELNISDSEFIDGYYLFGYIKYANNGIEDLERKIALIKISGCLFTCILSLMSCALMFFHTKKHEYYKYFFNPEILIYLFAPNLEFILGLKVLLQNTYIRGIQVLILFSTLFTYIKTWKKIKKYTLQIYPINTNTDIYNENIT